MALWRRSAAGSEGAGGTGGRSPGIDGSGAAAEHERPRVAPWLAEADRVALHRLARVAVGVAAGGLPRAELEATLRAMPDLRAEGAVFVTLMEGGDLRGCVGSLDLGEPLPTAVVRAATWAACDDMRFEPVSAAELDCLEIDVSVLGEPVLLHDPLSFEPGVDGVIVARDGRRGLLLPEVAHAPGMDRRAMLEIASAKAGLPRSAWRDGETRVYAFRTLRFGAGGVTTEPVPGGA